MKATQMVRVPLRLFCSSPFFAVCSPPFFSLSSSFPLCFLYIPLPVLSLSLLIHPQFVYSIMSNTVIIVGGGLSGLSAAHTVLEHGLNVLVIDKNAFFGGNSTKATSGINGALTKTQIRTCSSFVNSRS